MRTGRHVFTRGFLRGLGVLALLFGCASCRSVEGTRGLPPLIEAYPTPSSLHAEGGSELVVRPLGSIERGERLRVRALLPFVDLSWSEQETRHVILPLFRYQERRTEEGADLDWMFFPVLFGGSDPKEGSYFAVFPFGGKLRGLLGQEEIVFALFPLYWRQELMGRTSTHILWPFLNRVWGAGWSGGRFWPFYGRYLWRSEDGSPRSRRWFVLWPFYIRAQENLKRDPTEVFFTFPFYGSRENSRSLTRTYLWPFVVVHEDKRSGETLVGGFFFPFRFGPDQTDVWPLYGEKRSQAALFSGGTRTRYREFAVWPLQRYEEGRDPLASEERLWVLPFFWRFSYFDAAGGGTRSRLHVWPLAEYRERDGAAALDVFAPLWFDREDYRRQYGRLFALFRLRTSEEQTAWEFLYGSLYWRSDPKESIFSLLGGLLEFGENEEGFRFRLLYVIPPW